MKISCKFSFWYWILVTKMILSNKYNESYNITNYIVSVNKSYYYMYKIRLVIYCIIFYYHYMYCVLYNICTYSRSVNVIIFNGSSLFS